MKTIIMMLVLVVLSAFTKTTHIPDEVRWSKDFKLTKEHFQVVLSVPNHSDALAFITTGIVLIPDTNGVFRPIAYMYPKESYLVHHRIDSAKIKRVFNHEKRHFDLAEYIARCMNLELMYVSDYDLAVNIFDKYYNKLDSMQNLYDFESSYYIDGQLEWDAKIDSLLNIRNEQANPTGIMTEKTTDNIWFFSSGS